MRTGPVVTECDPRTGLVPPGGKTGAERSPCGDLRPARRSSEALALVVLPVSKLAAVGLPQGLRTRSGRPTPAPAHLAASSRCYTFTGSLETPAWIDAHPRVWNRMYWTPVPHYTLPP